MNDPCSMRRGESMRNLCGDLDGAPPSDCSAFRHPIKGTTFHELRGNPPVSIRSSDVINMNNIGMAETARSLGLTLKAEDSFGIASKRRRQNLEGDLTLQAQVPSAINIAHSAAPDYFENFELPQLVSMFEGETLRAPDRGGIIEK